MSSIFYLWKTTFKNRLLDLKNHPSHLVVTILVVLFFGFALVSTVFTPGEDIPLAQNQNLPLLGAILIGLFLFLLVTQIQKGLSSGGSFFSMADVNLLFLAPVSPRKILAYGLAKQVGMSLLLGFFILFQGATLRTIFGVGTSGLIALFVGYCLFLVVGEILALAIYSYTRGDDNRRRVVRAVLYCFGFLMAALFLTTLFKTQNFYEALLSAADSSLMEYIPVLGWTKAFTMGLIAGNFLKALVFLVLLIALIGLIILYIYRSESDYYEDVLQSAEKNYTTKTAAKDGRISDTKDASKISRKKTGIGRGKGASVFFFKHLLENRRSGYLFLNQFTLICTVVAILASLLAKEHVSLMLIFGMLCYLQVLTGAMGRWVKELTLPYIYMIPQNPFKKLVFASLESVVDSFVSGLIIFIPCGLILGAPADEIIAVIAARVGLAALLSAGNILIERILGNMQSKVLVVMLYYLILVVLLIPGAIAGVAVGLVAGNLAAGLFADCAVNVVIALIILALCRNLLHTMEMNIQ